MLAFRFCCRELESQKYLGVAVFVANNFHNPQLSIRSLLRSLKKDSILSTLKREMSSLAVDINMIDGGDDDDDDDYLGGEVLLLRFLLNLSMFSPKTSPVLVLIK